MCNAGLDGAAGHVLESYFHSVMKNELVNEFLGCIGISHHQLGIPSEKRHAVVTRQSAQCVFLKAHAVGLFQALIDTPLLVGFEELELDWVIAHIHRLPTPSQIQVKFVLDARNALRNPIKNTPLINKGFHRLYACALEQTDRATVIWENIFYLSQFGDHVFNNAVTLNAIELRDIGDRWALFSRVVRTPDSWAYRFLQH